MSGRHVSPTLVGRHEAMAGAARALQRTQAGSASHLLVAGEAGVGKTRLVAAIADLARPLGFEVLRGDCIRLGFGELPYAPLADILRTIARRNDRAALAALVGNDGGVLSHIAPTFISTVTVADGTTPREDAHTEGVAPDAARRRLLEAFLGLFGRMSVRAPLLLVVEDLHWADSASLDTLSFLLRTLRAERVGMVLTFRPDELHRRHPLRPWLGEVVRRESLERIELGPLGPDETRALIAAIGGTRPQPELVARIHGRSDGNPLYIEELLAQENVATGGPTLSPSLRDILLARILSVPPQAQALLGVAAVAGRSTDADVLLRVSGVSPLAFDAALEGCIDRRLLVLDHGGGGERVAFRHALIQEVAYDSLLPGARIWLHRAFGAILASEMAGPSGRDSGGWAEVSHHWDAARDEPRTLDAALRAAAQAEHAYAFAAAVGQYRRALAAWELVPDPEAIARVDRVEVLSRAAAAAWLQGGEGQIPLLQAAIAEADRLGDAVRGSLLRGRLGNAQWASGDPAEALVAHREAVALMPPGRPSAERAWILAGLAQALMVSGSDREAELRCEAAIALAREVGDRRVEGHALNTLSCVLTNLGRCDLASETMERALAIALDVGVPDDIGRAYHNATEILAICGRDERALELVHEGMDHTRAMGMELTWGDFISLHGAVIAYGLGRWDEAARFIEVGLLEYPNPTPEIYALARTVEFEVASGRWDAAAIQLARLGELVGGYEMEFQYTGPWSCARAELALWQKRSREAIAAVDDGLTGLERTEETRYRVRLLTYGMRAAAELAELARDRRDPEAEAEARAIAGSLQERVAPAVAAVAGMDGGLALELTAELATAAAEETRLHGASDPVAWHQAADRWLARNRPYRHAYARWREAEAHLGYGERATATSALHEAAETAARLGAGPLLDAIAALARRARIPIAGPPSEAAEPEPGPGDLAATELGLTPREREVLELVAQGHTNRQIAAALYISVFTAGVHVSRILGKLGASSRTEAAAIAYRRGIAAPSTAPDRGPT